MLKIKLYCILRNRADLSFEDQAEQCCLGGADALLLRGNVLTSSATLDLGRRIRDITRRHKALFFVGGRPDIALGADADGVHLEPDDVGIELAGRIIGPGKITGFAASSMGQAVAAADGGAGYVMVGPMFSQEKTALGIDIIRLIKKRVKVPVIASGAINFENVMEVMMAGADGAAVYQGPRWAGLDVAKVQAAAAGITPASQPGFSPK